MKITMRILVCSLLVVILGTFDVINTSSASASLFDYIGSDSQQWSRQRRQKKINAIAKLEERVNRAKQQLNELNYELNEIKAEREKTDDPQELAKLDVRQEIADKKLNALQKEYKEIEAELKRIKYM